MSDLPVKNDISNEKYWAAVCYVPMLNVVSCPVAAVKMVASPLVRNHSRQGLLLFGLTFLALFLTILLPFLGIIVQLSLLGAHFMAAYMAFNLNVDYKLPFIGDIAMKIPEFYLYKTLTGTEPDQTLLNK